MPTAPHTGINDSRLNTRLDFCFIIPVTADRRSTHTKQGVSGSARLALPQQGPSLSVALLQQLSPTNQRSGRGGGTAQLRAGEAAPEPDTALRCPCCQGATTPRTRSPAFCALRSPWANFGKPRRLSFLGSQNNGTSGSLSESFSGGESRRRETLQRNINSSAG
ncbi:hypothetical protein SRHO_G00309380 [Serrasalmus rhombeus]